MAMLARPIASIVGQFQAAYDPGDIAQRVAAHIAKGRGVGGFANANAVQYNHNDSLDFHVHPSNSVR